MSSVNPLSADWLAGIIAKSLPSDTSSQIKSPYDAIAVAVHAALTAVRFRLTGLSEEQRDVEPTDGRVIQLPVNWNAHSPSNFSFIYAHTQSAMEFHIKITRMANKAVIMGLAVGDDKNVSFDIKIDDYISTSSIPATPVPSDSELLNVSPSEVPTAIRQSILNIFISAGRLADFAALLRLQLIQKLLPSLHKEGYEEEPTTAGSRPHRPPIPDTDALSRPPPRHAIPDEDPLRIPPRPRPFPVGEMPPPGFEDEYDITRPPGPLAGPYAGPSRGYGDRDLYPAGLGPNDPFRPMGPGLGGPATGGGGGMHPTFDDPMFDPGRGRGREGYDPRAPPGARYDPTGPGDETRGSSAGRGGFPGGPRNPFGGFGGGDFI